MGFYPNFYVACVVTQQLQRIGNTLYFLMCVVFKATPPVPRKDPNSGSSQGFGKVNGSFGGSWCKGCSKTI